MCHVTLCFVEYQFQKPQFCIMVVAILVFREPEVVTIFGQERVELNPDWT